MTYLSELNKAEQTAKDYTAVPDRILEAFGGVQTLKSLGAICFEMITPWPLYENMLALGVKFSFKRQSVYHNVSFIYTQNNTYGMRIYHSGSNSLVLEMHQLPLAVAVSQFRKFQSGSTAVLAAPTDALT